MTNAKWQQALLPFMQLVIVLLTAFYLVVSYLQFSYFVDRVEKPPTANMARFLNSIGTNSTLDKNITLAEKRWIAQCFFEAYTVDARQQNAEFLLVSRTWIKYLGFMTGVVLAIVGAIFILGKLKDEQPNVIAGEKELLKLSLTSHSPGIVLAVLGTVLIFITILTHQNIQKTDAAVYLKSNASPEGTSQDMINIMEKILDSLNANEEADTTRKRPRGF